MNLYAVGCSFTHGHGALPGPANVCKHGDFVVNTHGKFDYAWPWQLEPHFDTVINDGYQGSGNDYVLRRTLRMLAHLDDAEISDWVFVIQITQPERKEFLDGSNNVFYKTQYHNLADDTFIDAQDSLCYKNCATHTQHAEYTSATGLSPLTDAKKHYATGFYYHCCDDEYLMYEHLKTLLLLTQMLENRRCNYLITGMTAMQYVPRHISINYSLKNTHSHNLMHLLPTNNQVKCFSEILQSADPDGITHIAPCHHPNELGHQAVADYILDEIKQRGWL